MNSAGGKAMPKGYSWYVLFDPTGLFRGRVFQTIDLRKPEESGFVDGTIFKSLDSPLLKIVYQAEIVTLKLTHSDDIFYVPGEVTNERFI